MAAVETEEPGTYVSSEGRAAVIEVPSDQQALVSQDVERLKKEKEAEDAKWAQKWAEDKKWDDKKWEDKKWDDKKGGDKKWEDKKGNQKVGRPGTGPEMGRQEVGGARHACS
ncbi:unnamed protein product [Prorocentrum cordatum]|uniref:Uncharacterized protein n=1 Tax=Prorocentrum cordatum TaxID=2364126 RepID=A0ABN9U810_9DINO|nr:unnamed protein product [Polarella glacialis]